MAHVLHLPSMEVIDDGDIGFELRASVAGLRRLADALSEGWGRVEGRAGAIQILLVEGLLIMSHSGLQVEISGGGSELESLGYCLRFLARGPQRASTVPYHLHVEHYEDHPWLSPRSEPATFTLDEQPVTRGPSDR